jgi:hypothetical protein
VEDALSLSGPCPVHYPAMAASAPRRMLPAEQGSAGCRHESVRTCAVCGAVTPNLSRNPGASPAVLRAVRSPSVNLIR